MGDFRRNSGGFGDRGRSSSRGRSFGGGGRSFGGRDRGDRVRREMHDVVCDECKKDCQVPFKPSTDKPVLCSDCFEKQGGSRGSSRGGAGVSKEQFDQLNDKLDKILAKLEASN